MANYNVGDRVIVKSKYFNEFNDHIGVIKEIVDSQHEILVKFDEEWSVEGEKVFSKSELKILDK